MERERERERERARALERARENEANQRRESGAIQLIGGAALTAVAGFSLWLAGPAILAGALVAGAAAVTVTAIQTSGNVIHSNNARAVAQAHLEYEERREQRQIRMLETWSSRYPQIEYGSDW
jgi:NaMN:DMB phosphoribosyltransferase